MRIHTNLITKKENPVAVNKQLNETNKKKIDKSLNLKSNRKLELVNLTVLISNPSVPNSNLFVIQPTRKEVKQKLGY